MKIIGVQAIGVKPRRRQTTFFVRCSPTRNILRRGEAYRVGPDAATVAVIED